LLGSVRFANGNLLWRGKNLCSVLQHVPGKTGIDHPGIFNVVVAKDAASREKYREYDSQNRKSDNRSEETLLNTNAQSFSPSGCSFIVSQDSLHRKTQFQSGKLPLPGSKLWHG
jgi:hypothetical protein